MTLDDITTPDLSSITVEVFNPETPFGGVQIFGLDDPMSTLETISVEVTNPEIPFGGVQVFGATDPPINIILHEGMEGPPGPAGPSGPTGPSGEGPSGATEVWEGPEEPVPQDQYLLWIDTDEPTPVGGGGGGGGDLFFSYTQLAPSATWNVAHNLDKFASVTVVDSGGSVIVPDVNYGDLNHVTLSFGSPTSGKAYFN